MRILWLAVVVVVGCRIEDPSETAVPLHDWETPCFSSGVPEPAPEPTVDCASLPEPPFAMTELEAPRGFHDLAFDLEGNVFGADTHYTLISAAADDTWSVLTAGLDESEQMDWLPDGDLAVATHSGIMRVTKDGAVSLISNRTPYGLVTGPDGMIYTADYDTVARTDPATGEVTTLVDVTGVEARMVNFSPDFSKMYVSRLGGNAEVYEVQLDGNLDPVGSPRLLASDVGEGGLHDTMGVDVCGNLYLSDMDSMALHRVTPDGEVSTLLDFRAVDTKSYGHGLEWGSGVGGWKADALYLSQPHDDNTVLELEIGVPSRCQAR